MQSLINELKAIAERDCKDSEYNSEEEHICGLAATELESNKIQTVLEYIKEHHDGNQAKFAEYLTLKTGIKVWPQMVTEWINKGFIVIDGSLYSKRRDLTF